jgi:NADH-quinone oxidoreductase subunit C
MSISESAQARPEIAALLRAFPENVILAADTPLDETVAEVAAKEIVPVLRYLKSDQQFERLSAITCVDWHPADPRFEVVYQLHSLRHNRRLRLKVRLGGASPELESAFSVYRAANWYEREVFDLFGVSFRNHPDLRRLLMPTYWEGHPLRKDFPVHGHKYDYKD